MKLSAHFTLTEFTRSQTATRRGIDNTPTLDVIEALRALCAHILDPLREHVQAPITVTSGYRSVPLNRAIGGSFNSQHVLGQAADIICAGVQTNRLFAIVRELELPFDQLILEFPNSPGGGWVHVSYQTNPRGQALIARKSPSGSTVYTTA